MSSLFLQTRSNDSVRMISLLLQSILRLPYIYCVGSEASDIILFSPKLFIDPQIAAPSRHSWRDDLDHDEISH